MTPPAADGWIPWLVIVPLAGAALAFLFPRRAAFIGLAGAVVLGVGTAGLIAQVLRHGTVAVAIGGWEAPLGIQLRADGLSTWLIAITAVIGVAVSVYATGYFVPADQNLDGTERRAFWPLWLFLWAGLNALFLSGDLFNLYVTLELTGFSAVALTALANTRDALTAAMRYLLASLLGSLCFLLGVGLIYGAYATLDLVELSDRAQSDPATMMALVLMTGGLLIKGAVFPLHFWLPPAHSSAAAPVSALLSALVIKAPFYLLVRLWLSSFASVATAHFSLLLGLLGVGALIWGGIRALQQTRLKLLIAYSTVAQVGYLLLVFPLGGATDAGGLAWSGAMLFVGAHACAKAALFLAAGCLVHALGHDDLTRFSGATRAAPRAVFALALAGISIMGLPPGGGFFAKWLLLSSAIQQGGWGWVAGMMAGTGLTFAYIMRVITLTLTKPTRPLPRHRVPPVMEWTALALALLAITLGLGSTPALALLHASAPFIGNP